MNQQTLLTCPDCGGDRIAVQRIATRTRRGRWVLEVRSDEKVIVPSEITWNATPERPYPRWDIQCMRCGEYLFDDPKEWLTADSRGRGRRVSEPSSGFDGPCPRWNCRGLDELGNCPMGQALSCVAKFDAIAHARFRAGVEPGEQDTSAGDAEHVPVRTSELLEQLRVADAPLAEQTAAVRKWVEAGNTLSPTLTVGLWVSGIVKAKPEAWESGADFYGSFCFDETEDDRLPGESGRRMNGVEFIRSMGFDEIADEIEAERARREIDAEEDE